MSVIALIVATPLVLWAGLVAYGRYRDQNLWLAAIRADKAAEAHWNASHPADPQSAKA